MCGIFGLIRNPEATDVTRATRAFAELGHHAMERGTDSAGFALIGQTGQAPTPDQTPRAYAEARYATHGHVTAIKDTVSFKTLWGTGDSAPLIDDARVAIGHTRWATQGKRDSRLNTSPLLAGNLIGTHNGDLDKASIRDAATTTGTPLGGTDTEELYLALSQVRHDPDQVTALLSKVEGRAALVWVDLDTPDRVFLARAALSPMALAWDRDGNFYWASNPRWFRDIDEKFGHDYGFHHVTLVTEGTLLTVDLNGDTTSHPDQVTFLPQSRPKDERLSDIVVWRGFDAADRAYDKAQARHTVAADRRPATTGYTAPKHGTPRTPARPDSWWPRDDHAADTSAVTTLLDAPTATSDDLDDLDESIAQDEASMAVDTWLDAGADETIVTTLRQACLPSEIEDIMFEYDLSTRRAFDLFRSTLLYYED